MHPTTYLRRRIAAGVLALAGLVGGSASAQPPVLPPPNAGASDPADVKIDPRTGSLIVPLGGVVKFTPPGGRPIRDITNRNDDILDARVDVGSPGTLVLVGRRTGATQLTLVFGAGDEEVRRLFDVVVQPDFELLKSVIRRAMPTAAIEIIPGPGTSIIVTGHVARPEDADLIMRIASDAVGGSVQNLINAIQVGGSQHVLIDVLVAQVDRSELRERGFSWGVSGATFGGSSIIPLAGGQSNVVQNLFNGFLSQPAITPAAQSNIQFGIVPGNFIGTLRALKSENLAKFLTEPKVVTQTGRPAFLRVGGQQAILGPAAGITGPGAVLQPFGTEVEVLPIVLGNGKIYLEVNPRISTVNNALGILTAFGFTPGFTEQQTRASVTLESGQTFAIGGLIENRVQAFTQKVPVIGEVPYVGTLFSGISYQEIETEVVVLVTPRLNEPMDCNQVPRRVPGKETRVPDDYEVFLETLIEAPRGQRQVWTGKHYNPAYKCDQTYGKYPCIGNLCPGGAAGYCAPAGGPVVGVPVIAPVGMTGQPVGNPVVPAADTQAPPVTLPEVAPPADAGN